MKKILLGTSALVALGSVAFAGSAPSMTVTGVAEVQMSVIGVNQETANNNSSGFLPTGHDITMPSGSNEIHFKGEGKTDSGLIYGARYEFRPGTGPDAVASIDEAVIYFAGDWGRLDLGQEDQAGELMTINGAQNTGATGGWAGDTWLTAKDNAQNLTSLANGLRRVVNANDSSKVTYRSPVINGVQVGASFTPTWSTYNNVVDVAAKFSQKVGDVTLGVYGEVMRGNFTKEATGNPTTNNARKSAIGASVAVGPIAISTSYVNHGKTGIKLTTVAGDATNAGTLNDVGVSYTMPDGTVVGAGMARGQQSIMGQEKKKTSTWYTVGATTPVAPGATAYFEYNNDVSDNGKGALDSKTTGQEVLVGTKVSF